MLFHLILHGKKVGGPVPPRPPGFDATAKEMTHYFDHRLVTENVNFFLAYWNWSRE